MTTCPECIGYITFEGESKKLKKYTCKDCDTTFYIAKEKIQ